MSQLSSGGRITRQKAKKSYDTLWFLLVFTVICVIVTGICIYNTLHPSNNKNSSNNLPDKALALGDKSWINGIETENISYTEGDIVVKFDNSNLDPLYEYDISYEQISGLKNKKIQDKINEDIKSEVLKLKNLLKENSEYDRIIVSSYISGNFADVLSVSLYYYLTTENTYSTDVENLEVKSINGTKGLNYRLDTGEKLEFKDLFLSTANIKAILSNALYEAFAWEHMYSDENMEYNFDNTDYGYIENQTFKALSQYNKNPDIDFYFTSNYIYAVIKDFSFTINMMNNCDELAIYSKYVSKDNLYENENLKKEMYAFTDSYLVDTFEVEGDRGDNFYYEIKTYPNNIEKDDSESEKQIKEEALEVARSKVDEKLAHYYEIAQKNPNKAYMVSIMYSCDIAMDEEIPYYQYSGEVAEMDIEYFNSHKNEIIAKSRIQITGDISYSYFSSTNEEVEFYEDFNAYVDDYRMEDYQEDVTTKEERAELERQWKEEREKEEQWSDSIISTENS